MAHPRFTERPLSGTFAGYDFEKGYRGDCMDFQQSGMINSQTNGLDIGYNNYNSSGAKEDVFVSRGKEGVRELSQIPVGKAFRGEVSDMVGNKVTIRLDNGQSVQARLAEPMDFNIGDKILFQVKSNGDGMIEIKPMMMAMGGQEATILKALEAAALPVNEKTVEMLQNLLKAQMPIDRNSLQNMYKQVVGNNGASIQTIVQMTKSQIPITKENIGQFEAYQNYEHRIVEEAKQLSGQLAGLVEEMSAKNPKEAVAFQARLLQIFGQEPMPNMQQQQPLSNTPVQGSTAETLQFLQESEVSQSAALPLEGEKAPAAAQGPEQFQFQPQPQTLSETAIFRPLDDKTAAAPEEKVFLPGQIGNELTKQERESLFELVKELPLAEETKAQILSGDGRTQEVLNELNKQLQQSQQLQQFQQLPQVTQVDVKKLFGHTGYKKLLASQIQKNFMIQPEQLAAGERMEAFYEKLVSQNRQLEQLMKNAGQEESTAAKTASGIRENVDFMNQVNELFTYVQIPLQMSHTTAHSDLYVFTKKKNLMDKDGKISALLHLDMDVIGCLDVYVEMDGFDIRTQFKLPDEGSVKLFESNMDFLRERIVEKGYQFQSQVDVQKKQMDFVEDFLQRDHGNAPMQRFAFDVRA